MIVLRVAACHCLPLSSQFVLKLARKNPLGCEICSLKKHKCEKERCDFSVIAGVSMLSRFQQIKIVAVIFLLNYYTQHIIIK